jgi:hypothetical protein
LNTIDFLEAVRLVPTSRPLCETPCGAARSLQRVKKSIQFHAVAAIGVDVACRDDAAATPQEGNQYGTEGCGSPNDADIRHEDRASR